MCLLAGCGQLRPTGSVGGPLGLHGHQLGWALVVQRLDLAAAKVGGVHFAVCLMVVVSCGPGVMSAIYDCLVMF